MRIIEDAVFMRRCFELAQCGRGFVSPNPMVGCVITHQDRILSEGYHRLYGGAHAEVNAIESALSQNKGSLLRESTLYVNLEPCSHHGQTPPCAERLVEYGFKRVVVSCGDPNPKVNGQGIRLLREHGIEVCEHILEDEGLELNSRFFTYIQKQRPYILLKWAQTADGFMAPEGGRQSAHITDTRLQIENHKLRAQEDALMVGTRTLLCDHSHLNTRYFYGKNPLRVSFDLHGRLPSDLPFFDGSQASLLFVSPQANRPWIKAPALQKNALHPLQIIEIPSELLGSGVPPSLFWQEVGKNLSSLGIASLVVEGGAILLQNLIEADYYDECRIFESDGLWGKGYAAPHIPERLFPAQKTISYPPSPLFDHKQQIRFFRNS